MTLDNYPGAKSGSGITQWLINQIPAHERYFELFAGSAQLFQAKKRADISILADIDFITWKALNDQFFGCCRVYNMAYMEMLICFLFTRNDFIYLDPPYPKTARRTGKAYYRHEMLEDADHVKLLTTIRDVPANIMISTRQNDLYDKMLPDWRKETFQTMDRGGAL